MGLTLKQRAFVEYLLGDPEVQWNATGAARKAGYKHPDPQGCQNLGKPSIQRFIRQRLEELGASTKELVAKWLMIVRADISPFISPAGLNIEALKAAGLGFLIKGAKVTRWGVTFELRDPDRAAEMLARHLGTFAAEKLEVKHEFVTMSDTDLDKEIAAAIELITETAFEKKD